MTCLMRRLLPEDNAALKILRGFSASEAAWGNLWQTMSDERCEALLSMNLEGADLNGQALFGVFESAPSGNSTLIGVVGLRRELRPTTRHKASLWGLYVVPGKRRQGIGTLLVMALVDEARRTPGLEMIRLVVLGENRPAIALLQKQGFRVYATEPRARFREGRYYDEAFLLRPLTEETFAKGDTA